MEILWGRERLVVDLDAPAVLGSGAAVAIRIPAGFIAAEHAIVEPDSHGRWQIRILVPGVTSTGRPSSEKVWPLGDGETVRLTDANGNLLTLKSLVQMRRVRDQQLRSLLPSPQESYLIGSDPSCAVTLQHPLVQPRHAALRRDEAGSLWIEDRKTNAGTYVNGHRLRGKQRLSDGDIVQVGPYTATVGATALEPLEQVAGVDIDVAGATLSAGSRRLLKVDHLHLPAASLTAVVGPSGAGKTTLMRLLSGQVAASTGTVAYNGVDLSLCRDSYAALTGFVPQDDVVHTELSIDEALHYQVRLRLGQTTPPQIRRQLIDKLIGMLGLQNQRTQLVKTLSGGQRKRLSIACELLKEPELLLLDEPTSGLDPGLDKRMMLLLRLLADQGRTIVLTTHAIAHVDVCDNLILVGPGGHLIYAGPPAGAVEAFGVGTLGDVFSLIDTPEAAQEAATRQAGAARPHQTGAPGPDRTRTFQPRLPGPAMMSGAWWRALTPELRIFSARHMKILTRDYSAAMFTLLQGVAVVLLTAAVAPSPLTWNENSNSMLFVLGCAAVWFGMIGSVRELVKERQIWRREQAGGANPYSYLASKLVVLGALALVQALTMTVLLASLVGLPTTSPVGSAFGSFLITLWLAGIGGMGLGLLVSATSLTADRALSLVPYLLIGQLVLSGVLFHLGALEFVGWLTPARWSVSSLGGVAGLDAAKLAQSSGLYPHTAAGLVGGWVVMLALAAVTVVATAAALQRQARAWTRGQNTPAPLWKALTNGVADV